MISKRAKDTLGQGIKSQRKRLDMTQDELAEIMHIPKSTISAYENDKVDIKGSVIVELSKCLFTNPNYLLGFDCIFRSNCMPIPIATAWHFRPVLHAFPL